jgi:hypothetical protein
LVQVDDLGKVSEMCPRFDRLMMCLLLGARAFGPWLIGRLSDNRNTERDE